MKNQVECNECKELIPMQKIKRKVYKGLAYGHYFNCPECDHKYISYYTDQRLRRDIKRQEKRWEVYRTVRTEDERRKLLAEINMNKKLMEKDMDKLRKKMMKVLK